MVYKIEEFLKGFYFFYLPSHLRLAWQIEEQTKTSSLCTTFSLTFLIVTTTNNICYNICTVNRLNYACADHGVQLYLAYSIRSGIRRSQIAQSVKKCDLTCQVTSDKNNLYSNNYNNEINSCTDPVNTQFYFCLYN